MGWPGDVATGKKQRFLKAPQGVLLITPESLEALFVTRGISMAGLMANLRYVVIDELHAFIGSERETTSVPTPPARTSRQPSRARGQLSATLGDITVPLVSSAVTPRKS